MQTSITTSGTKGISWASSGLLHFSVDSLRFIADAELISHWDYLLVFDLDVVQSKHQELASFLEEFKGLYSAVIIPKTKPKQKFKLLDRKSRQLIQFPFYFKPMKFTVADLERRWFEELKSYDIPGFSFDKDHQILETELHKYLSKILLESKDPLAIVSQFAGYFSRKVLAKFAWSKLPKSEKEKLLRESIAQTIRNLKI